MKNFNLIEYLKSNPLLKEIKTRPGSEYLEIKFSPTNDYGEARDKTKLIIPKFANQFDQDQIEYLQSSEPIIPEEDAFFMYLDIVFDEYEKESKNINLYKADQRHKFIENLINDLYNFININDITAIFDSSPRDDIYSNLGDFIVKIFPESKKYFGDFFNRYEFLQKIENNDYQYFIDKWLYNLNEIKTISNNEFNQATIDHNESLFDNAGFFFGDGLLGNTSGGGYYDGTSDKINGYNLDTFDEDEFNNWYDNFSIDNFSKITSDLEELEEEEIDISNLTPGIYQLEGGAAEVKDDEVILYAYPLLSNNNSGEILSIFQMNKDKRVIPALPKEEVKAKLMNNEYSII